MYSDSLSPGLWQGDVLGPVFVPAMASEIRFLPRAQPVTSMTEEQRPEEAIIRGSWRFVAVVSHECEFNADKRTRFLVARIQAVPRDLTPERRVALRESNDVEARARAGQEVASVNTFLFDPAPDAFEEESVADFTSITTLPMGAIEQYVALKKAELQPDHRVLFRKKLAWFFSRGLEPPDPEEHEETAEAGSA